jgi:hypothetical protein
MGYLVSKIPDLMMARNLGSVDLIRLGLSPATAFRAARGETDFQLATVVKIMDALGVTTIDDLFRYEANAPSDETEIKSAPAIEGEGR